MSTDPIKKIYELLNAHSPRELSDRYLEEDQKIVTSGISNYHDPNLLINKVRFALERIDARHLSREERYERRLILWLWYHHAISYAIWGDKNVRQARKYSTQAIRYQPKNHSNHITRLLYLLVRHRLTAAVHWAKKLESPVEKAAAKDLIGMYKNGEFFNDGGQALVGRG